MGFEVGVEDAFEGGGAVGYRAFDEEVVGGAEDALGNHACGHVFVDGDGGVLGAEEVAYGVLHGLVVGGEDVAAEELADFGFDGFDEGAGFVVVGGLGGDAHVDLAGVG